MLDELQGWTSEYPPVAQNNRFGNKAYRDWHARLDQVGLSACLVAWWKLWWWCLEKGEK